APPPRLDLSATSRRRLCRRPRPPLLVRVTANAVLGRLGCVPGKSSRPTFSAPLLTLFRLRCRRPMLARSRTRPHSPAPTLVLPHRCSRALPLCSFALARSSPGPRRGHQRLRFGGVRPPSRLAHSSLTRSRHPFAPPVLAPRARSRLDLALAPGPFRAPLPRLHLSATRQLVRRRPRRKQICRVLRPKHFRPPIRLVSPRSTSLLPPRPLSARLLALAICTLPSKRRLCLG
ncbi:hypothetical protein FRC08_017267, partial [Ceratobasidium sp. 394]